jgi:hypothetical protein
MTFWESIIDLGDTEFSIPLACAIAAMLAAARAWRLLFLWVAAFSFASSVVVLSKIGFRGWGTGIPQWEFKSISGHAMRVTAVATPLLFLMTSILRKNCSALINVVGLAVGLLMTTLLVVYDRHSIIESAIGFALGSGVAGIFAVYAENWMPPDLNRVQTLIVGSVCFLAAWYANPASYTYLITRLALYFSGNPHPYSWTTWKMS